MVKYGLIALLAIVAGLGGRAWYLQSVVSKMETAQTKLKAEIEEQATTIGFQENQIVRLEQALEREKQAVISQQKIANELKNRTQSKQEKVRVVFKTEKVPCANEPLPRAVIEQLR